MGLDRNLTAKGPAKQTKQLGAVNLMPEKYRRLIRTVETNKPVGADYVFPSALSGDQTQLTFIQDTLTKARLKIIEEFINVDADPLVGGKTGEFGNLVINEEIVEEGELPLVGELIQDSQVTPFGDGKAIRITVRYPSDIFTKSKVTRSIGSQESLTPQKYRRLIRNIETERPVPVNYTFPTGLTGDQVFIEFAQKTITEARLKIMEEVILESEDPLLGSETDDYGLLRIYESVVDDGTAADSGFGVKHSQVTPLGNEKSIKITVKYPDAGVAEVIIITPSSGYTNGTYSLGWTGGTGSGAAGTYTVEGTVVVRAKITAAGIYAALPTPTFPSGGGSGAVGVAIEGHPAKISRLFDEEMLVTYPKSEQVIQVITDAQAILLQAQSQSGEMKELKGVDVWHSILIKKTKTPLAVDEASAIISYRKQPYTFPGRFDHALYTVYGILSYAYQRPHADLIQITQKTWWQISTTAPVISVPDIIPTTFSLDTNNIENVLADGFNYVVTGLPVALSTPTYTEFSGITYLSSPGLTFTNGSATVTGTSVSSIVSANDRLWGVKVLSSGSGSATLEVVWPFATGTYTYVQRQRPSTGWIGNLKVIGANVTPTPQKNLWKIETQSVVMR